MSRPIRSLTSCGSSAGRPSTDRLRLRCHPRGPVRRQNPAERRSRDQEPCIVRHFWVRNYFQLRKSHCPKYHALHSPEWGRSNGEGDVALMEDSRWVLRDLSGDRRGFCRQGVMARPQCGPTDVRRVRRRILRSAPLQPADGGTFGDVLDLARRAASGLMANGVVRETSSPSRPRTGSREPSPSTPPRSSVPSWLRLCTSTGAARRRTSLRHVVPKCT